MDQVHRVSTTLAKHLIDFTERENLNSVHWANFFETMRSFSRSAFFYMMRKTLDIFVRKLLNTSREGDQQLSLRTYNNVAHRSPVYQLQWLSHAGKSALAQSSGIRSLGGYKKLLSPVGSGLYRLAVSGALAALLRLERAAGWLKPSKAYAVGLNALLPSDSPAFDDTTEPADMVQRIHYGPNITKENNPPPKKVSIAWFSIKASLCGADGLVIEPKVALAASFQHLAEMA